MISPLRTLRQSKRLSRAALGSIAGVHPGIIGDIERGDTRNPSGRTLIRLANGLSRVLDRPVQVQELLPAEAPHEEG